MRLAQDHTFLLSGFGRYAAFSLFAISLLPAFGEKKPIEPEAERLAKSGEEKLKNGDARGAIQDFDAALKIDIRSDVAYFSRNDAYLKLGDHAGWAQACKSGATEDAQFGGAGRKNPECRVPDMSEVFVWKCLGCSEKDWLGFEQRNLIALSGALSKFPRYAVGYNDRGSSSASLSQWPTAISDFRTAKALTPQYARIRANLARTLYASGDKISGMQEANEAIPLFTSGPDHRLLLKVRSGFHEDQNKFDLAEADLTAVIQSLETEKPVADDLHFGDAHPYLARARVRQKSGKFKEALSDADAYIAGGDHSKYPDGYAARGDANQGLGDFAGAATDFTKAFESSKAPYRPQGDPLYRARRADQNRMIPSKRKEAVEDYDAFLQANPENAVGLLFRGFAQFDLGEFKKAEADFEKSFRLNPELNNGQAQVMLAETKIFQKDFGGAIGVLDAYLSRNVNQPYFLYRRGFCYAESNNFPRGLIDYRLAAAQATIDAGTLNAMAWDTVKRTDDKAILAESEKWITGGMALDPASADLVDTYAEILTKLGKKTEATNANNKVREMARSAKNKDALMKTTEERQRAIEKLPPNPG